MSYILDALKKMEREKVKKARAGGMTSISGELFSEERPRTYRGGAWKIIAVAVVTSCVAMTATWLYLKPDKTTEKTAQRSASPAVPPPMSAAPATPQPSAPVQTSAQPPVPPSAAAVPAQPAAQTPAPAAALQKTPASQPPAGASPVPAETAPVAQPLLRKADSRRVERKAAQSAPRPEQRPAVATIAPPADIKVSGIAWQEARSARRVVVNGFLLKEGGMVAGARIVEILPDRVRFSTSGGEFELSMVASGIPGATK